MFLSMNNFFREFWADLILKQKIYKQGPKLHFQKKKKNFWVLHNKSFFIDREKSREKEKGVWTNLEAKSVKITRDGSMRKDGKCFLGQSCSKKLLWKWVLNTASAPMMISTPTLTNKQHTPVNKIFEWRQTLTQQKLQKLKISANSLSDQLTSPYSLSVSISKLWREIVPTGPFG